MRELRLAERGVRFSDVGDASASTLPIPRLGRRMLRLLELFLQQRHVNGVSPQNAAYLSGPDLTVRERHVSLRPGLKATAGHNSCLEREQSARHLNETASEVTAQSRDTSQR